MIRSVIACAALIVFGLIADAHEAVVRRQPHVSESHKPHAALSRRPHAAVSHGKTQKPPKRQALHAKPSKVSKH